MSVLWYVIPAAGVVSGLFLQVRVGLRDRGDRKFAREVFQQTRSTEALKGYTQLVEKRRALPTKADAVEPVPCQNVRPVVRARA